MILGDDELSELVSRLMSDLDQQDRHEVASGAEAGVLWDLSIG